MSQFSTLVTGDGAQSIVNLPFLPEFILVGETDTDLPIKGFAVTVAGEDTINIGSQALIQAYSKFLMEGILGADVKVAQVLKISDGFVPAQNTQVKLTNAGATTPAIFAYSSGKGESAIQAGTLTVQASSFELFEDFMGLIFDPANVDYAEIEFIDGHVDKLTPAELRALFMVENQADADGELAGLIVIDNMGVDDDDDPDIATVKLYNTNGGSTTVLKVS